MPLTKEEFSPATIVRALESDDQLLRRLVDRIIPVIQLRAARALLRRARMESPERLKNEVEDLVQDVLLSLFADGGRVLRKWDPGRGLSLSNFVGLVAERLVSTVARSRKRLWPADFRPDEDLDGPDGQKSPEAQLEVRQSLTRMVERLRSDLSQQGFELFIFLFVEELSVDEVQERTGLSPDAIYAWRSRLRRKTRLLMEEESTLSANTGDAEGVRG